MTDARVALVTGSARGIGRAIAEALARSGHRVVGADVIAQEPGVLDRVAQVDLADPGACRELIADVGRIDVLVNNAAILIEKPIEAVELRDFDLTVAVNLRAVFLLSQTSVVGMSERGWGRIINISSIGARTGGLSQSAVYAATKAGVIALTKNFARNYGPRGITANAVAPGAVDAPMARLQQLQTPGMWERITQEVALRRFAHPSEVAAVVDFLAGDAASFVTGATIDVNGGWLMT